MDSSKELPMSVGQSSGLQELQALFQVVSQGKRLWEATFDAIVDPVLLVSDDYRVERANRAAAAAAGVDVRDLGGKTCFQIFAKRTEPCVSCPLAGETGHESGRGSLAPFSDGREYSASSYPVRGREGEPLGLHVLQYQDMSQIRKLESQLLQKDKMAALGLFASGIAHDINNPLSGVLAFAQLALEETREGTQLHGDLLEIQQAALRCKKIIEELLEFSRPVSKSESIAVDLGELVQKLLPNLEVQFKDLNYRLRIELKSLTPVWLNPSKLEQVFTNILTNAFQAISSGGEIRIISGEDKSKVFVEISDDGEGIAPENLHSIFDPYFTTKRGRGGTGLGLPITYNIVREYGGRIQVKSVLGKGTTFRVLIPKGYEA